MSYNIYFEKAQAAGRKPTLAPALINQVLQDVAAEAIAQTA
jgi:glutamate-5-semialdehyde dehydrogenase